jgi:hypothetical protein
VPFVATTIAEACGKHLNEKPPAVSSLAPTVPASLERLIGQLLAKDPAARPASMLEVARAFALNDKEAIGSAPTLTTEPVSLPRPEPAERRSRALPILLAVLVLGGGAAGAVYYLQATRSIPVTGDAEVALAPPELDAAAMTSPDAALAPPAPDAAPLPATPPPAADAALPPDARIAAKPPKPAPGESASSTDGADAEELQQAVHARSAQTNRCYEAALKDDPTLSGTVTLQIKIDATGRVISASADGLSESLQSCLVAQVRDIKFPRPQDPPVSLIVPFRFERE